MTLKYACELADECGLSTVEEAILNVKFHALSLFTYDEAEAELSQLDREFSESGFELDTDIMEVIRCE